MTSDAEAASAQTIHAEEGESETAAPSASTDDHACTAARGMQLSGQRADLGGLAITNGQQHTGVDRTHHGGHHSTLLVASAGATSIIRASRSSALSPSASTI